MPAARSSFSPAWSGSSCCSSPRPCTSTPAIPTRRPRRWKVRALQGGHVLLHGWFLPLDPFWTVDAPIFAVAVLVGGLRPSLLALEPALVAAAVVVVGVLMARTAVVGRQARTAAVVAGGGTVVALLGLPTVALALFYLENGFHIGTALWALLAFAAFARGRFDRAWGLGVLALATGLLGDLELVAYGVLPVAVAGLAAIARGRSWRAGVSLLAGAAAGCAVAEGARRAVVALGGFTTGPRLPFAHFAQMKRNITHVLGYGSDLVGIGQGMGRGLSPAWLYDLHAAGGLLIVAALGLGIYRLVAGALRGDRRAGAGRAGDAGGDAPAGAPDDERATGGADGRSRRADPATQDDLLVLGTLGVAASYVASALSNNVGYVRYLDSAVIFAAILAGRTVARAVQRSATWEPAPAVRACRRGAAVFAVAIALACGASSGFLLTRPVPPSGPRMLAAWLDAHGLHEGIGDYWAASITTVESSGTVEVRPVSLAYREDRLGRMLDQSAASWYQGQHFQFLVYDNLDYNGVDGASAAATFGPPAHTYVVGIYHVLVWKRDLTVAAYPGVFAGAPGPAARS